MWPFSKSNKSIANEAFKRLGFFFGERRCTCLNCMGWADFLYREKHTPKPLGGFHITNEELIWAYCNTCHAITTLSEDEDGRMKGVKVQHFHDWLEEQKPELVDMTMLERGLEKINKDRDQVLTQLRRLSEGQQTKQLGPYRTASAYDRSPIANELGLKS